MCSADIVDFLLQAAVVTVFWLPIADTSTTVVNDIQTICSKSDVDVVVVIDTTSTSLNTTEFLVQQHRLLRTLKRLSNKLNGTRSVSNLVASVRQSGQSTSNSVVRALDEALSMFFESRPTNEFDQRHKIIILAHDGVNTDLVAETVETVSNVEKLGVVVFALTGSSRPNTFALLGYAGLRDRLFISDTDHATFQDSLDEVLGICENNATSLSTSSKFPKRRRIHGVLEKRSKDDKQIFLSGRKCDFKKVDLIIVLDTSGSVFRVFDDQRAIALEIMEEIPLDAFADSVQVSVIRFAASADVILPFLKGRAYSEIKDTVREVKFTGQNTRIAGAVEIAVDEMMRARRPDAVQVFVLISDGHGQEYWNVVQATGKRLQKTGAELFAVSASPDYNKAELLIYVGDESRVFVGRKYDR
uniref:VWFA domain-containing protein n=1 Tax=Angiostrongylus cantonensis TaxID=6313 RepID=A0A0K0D025_ANGCA